MEMKAELVFIPIPEIGHFQSMLQLANHLPPPRLLCHLPYLQRLFCHRPPPPAAFTLTGIRFINLPQVDLPQVDDVSGVDCYLLSLQLLKPQVKHAILTHVLASDSPQLAGLVLDPLASAMIDLAAELDVASYIYFPSGAAMLEQVLRFPDLDSQVSELPATELTLPISANSVLRFNTEINTQ
ncbi:UDP-glycosyltransferase 71A16 [Vitis vinifera]|uniref:UDP-glycosyltransferase 71A16 n=1 Tax=Vitis vinifera TaxID=29760 RepID=A0A438IAU8_VITVI|nr:UDP-glycosyltransferase 71A16 [Vitis vinifera]